MLNANIKYVEDSWVKAPYFIKYRLVVKQLLTLVIKSQLSSM